jgi:SAM-dependent methyltransferase
MTAAQAEGRAPIARVWHAVNAQTGAARAWHLDNFVNHQLRYIGDLRLVMQLLPAGAIVEVGSAPCHMTALLKLSGYSVTGVDIDPQRVGAFIDEFDLDVRRCDIEREPLPFPDGAFACAMLCDTFEHLRIDPGWVLTEIHRVLAPDALLVLTTPNVYSLPSIARYLTGRSIADPAIEFGKLRRLGHMGHVREYSASEVARFLHATGFAPQWIAWRSYPHAGGVKGRLLDAAYRCLPRRFRREIVIVARKAHPAPRLELLVPRAHSS